MRKLAILLTSTVLMISLLSVSAPNVSGDLADPPQIVEANMVFPPSNLTRIENATGLALYLLQALGLPPVLNGTIVNHGLLLCCLVNWEHRRVPMENHTEILYNTSDGQVLGFEYWDNGGLAKARVVRHFGDELFDTSLSSLYERAETYANNLGINSTSYERIYRNSTERFFHFDMENGTWQGIPTTEVVLYSNYSGLSIAFGNELRITFDLELKQARELIIYPWFTAPSPILTPYQASDIAVDFLNGIKINKTSTLIYVDAYLAFDSYHYSLTYQVEVKYQIEVRNSFIDTTSYYIHEYRAWVDPYDGTVTYWVYVPKFIPPIPLTSSTNMWLLILVSFIVVVLAIMVAAFLFWTMRNGGRRKGKKSIKI